MESWSKYEPFVILVSLVLGFLCSNITFLSYLFEEIEEYLFIILLFFIFFEIDWVNLKDAFFNKKFVISDLIINFIWTPILAYILGLLLFPQNIYLRIALVLLLVLPCTDWYLIFTNMTGGNVELSTSILPYNLIIQLIVLPVCLFCFFGETDFLKSISAVSSILELLIPLALAIIARIIFNRYKEVEEKIHEASDKIEYFLVCLIAFAIFAADGKELLNSLSDYPIFIIAVIIFYCFNFYISYNCSKKLKFSFKDMVSLVFTTTSRNSPLSLTLSGLLFPKIRIISVILLIGPITEIPFSLLISMFLRKIYNKKIYPNIYNTKI